MALAPNEVLGDGRFRLLARRRADEFAGMEFWRAWDFRHETNVAITALTGDPHDQAAVASARQVLEGIRWAESAAHPALARVIDLLGPGPNEVLGLVITEWVDGVDLFDMVSDGPLRVATACRLLRPLVAAVDGAHHMGVVAGVDSAERIRVGEHGTAVLAFRGTRPGATTRDDVRGLGALLYVLLTARWPDVADPVPPADLRPDVPRDLSLIAVLSIDGTRVPDIRTCGPLLRAMDEVIAYDPDIDTMDMPLLMGPSLMQPLVQEPPQPAEEPAPAPRPRSRGRLVTLAVAILAVAVAVLVGAKVAGAFSGPAPRPAAASSPRTTVPTTTTTPPPTTTTTPSPAPPAPVRPTHVTEYLVTGNPDDVGDLGNAIDGDPNTSWSTDIYREQFPAFIPGIGLMAQLPHPMALTSITITSPTPGTVVQIHSASSPNVSLSSAPLLATATLNDGTTTIPLHSTAPMPYVLVWITQLSQQADGYGSVIAEISCQPAA